MERDGYVVYGSVPWDGPWAVDQNLAHAIAARHRVLYVDPPVSPLTPLRRQARSTKLRAVADRRLRDRVRLQVFRPLVLPPIEHPRARRASRPLLHAQIASAARRAGLHAPVALSFRPLAAVAGAAGERARIAVVMDDLVAGAALLGRDPAALDAELRQTCTLADAIVTPSDAVRRLLADRGFAAERLPFGFAADLAERFDSAPVPAEYVSLPRPLIGYTGSVDDRLDFDLIETIANRSGGATLVIVGALSPRLSAGARARLGSCANVRLLGARPRDQLPAYIRHLDVALMPYADSAWTRSQSPLKVWEYLYAGPPIVATGSPELRSLPAPLVHYADTPHQVPELVERALADPLWGREQRRETALENTWDHRAVELQAIVERLAPGSAGPTPESSEIQTAASQAPGAGIVV